jgi:hypothetical protein
MAKPSTREYGTPEDILRVLQHLRRAFTDLLLAVGLDPSATRASARELGLSKDVFWRVARITLLDQIVSSQIPSRASMERVVEAIQQRGASEILLKNTRMAIDEFEAMVASSSTNRATFDMMLSGLATDGITERQETIRKQAFLANSSIWGVQTQVAFKAFFLAPAKDCNRIDLANLSGMVGFRRLRQVAWPVYQRRIYDDRGSASSLSSEPYSNVPESAGGLPLFSEYCSKPLPEISWRQGNEGMFYEIQPDLIGNAGATTFVLGGISRHSAARYRDDNNDRGGLIYELFTPAEFVNVDMFLHRDLPYEMPPGVSIFDRLSSPRGYNPDMDERRQLPLSSGILSLGTGISGCSTLKIPNYIPMLEQVMNKIGFDKDDFKAYRFSMKFPPIPSAIIFRFNLPEPPDRKK